MAVAGTEGGQDSALAAAERAHVLVVEDDPDMGRLIVHRLEQAGYRVTSAADGRSALAAAQKTRPDLIVLDWMMPGLTGVEVCTQIRADEAIATTRILMLSAKSQQSDIAKAFACGIDEFLRKPFSLRELILGIDSLLAKT
ncbi:response regulator transcription factor [Cryobacterium roopkundense]|nr:response regulator [Cryobacterium roopkundense]